MSDLRARVAALLADPGDALLARSILGTDDAEAIAARVEAWTRDALGRAIVACDAFVQSVGSVFLVTLDDGSRAALKAHAIGGGRWRAFASIDELRAVYAAEDALAKRGVPCARAIAPPRPFGAEAMAAMAAMERLDVPDGDMAHAPSTRVAMAEGLARFAEAARAIDAGSLPRVGAPAGLYPPPHNALFDFDAPGGEWIDARARRARAVLDAIPERRVVMHTDFSCANVRVANGAIAAIFDMDSVAVIDEMRAVASTAVHFTYEPERWTWPSRDEAIAFVRDYERARGRPFDADERARLDASAIAALAYTSRCEQGADPDEREPPRMRALLRDAPDAYFG